MSLISVFVDAFKKAIGREPAVDIEEVRSTGGLGPSEPYRRVRLAAASPTAQRGL